MQDDENNLTEYEIAERTVPAPQRVLSEAEEIEQLLLQHTGNAPPALVTALDAMIDRAGYTRAGEAFRHLLHQIPENTAAAVALRRVLLGDKQETARDAGDRCGVSHVSILKAEKRIRRWTGYQERP